MVILLPLHYTNIAVEQTLAKLVTLLQVKNDRTQLLQVVEQNVGISSPLMVLPQCWMFLV